MAELLDLTIGQSSLHSAIRELATAVKNSYPGLPFNFQVKVMGETCNSTD